MLLAALVLTSYTLDLDRVVKDAIGKSPMLGVAVGVAVNGKIAYTQGFGYSDLSRKERVTSDTQFHIDSITKQITAAAILKLQHDRKLTIGDDIGKYLPKFEGRGIKIKYLLNHTSGLGNYNDLSTFNDKKLYTSAEIEDMIANSNPIFDPGTSWSYSNSGFFLLGLIIERVTGQSYGEYVAEHIFKPLKMKDSGLISADPVPGHFAKGYVFKNGKFEPQQPINWRSVGSAGAVTSTVSDLLRFEIALDKNELLNMGEVISMRALTKLGAVDIPYGYGTRQGAFDHTPFYGHTGSGAGYHNVVETYPTRGLTIAVLTNSEAGVTPQHIASAIARHLLNLPEKQASPVPLDPEVARLKFGTYRTENGNIDVFVKDNILMARLSFANNTEIPLTYLGRGDFARFSGDRVHVVSENGVATWFLEYSEGMFSSASQRIR